MGHSRRGRAVTLPTGPPREPAVRLARVRHRHAAAVTHQAARRQTGLASTAAAAPPAGHLWMHQPWEHSGEICDMFRDGTLTNDRLTGCLDAARPLGLA